MRSVIIVVLVTMLSACGTLGGAVSGAGRDLQRAGSWIDYTK
jgi:predicted small secreted protein